MSELLQRVADGEFHDLIGKLNSRNARCVDMLHALGELLTASLKVDGMKATKLTDVSSIYGNVTGKQLRRGSMPGYHFGIDNPSNPIMFHPWKVTDVTICKPGDDCAEVLVTLFYTERPQKAPNQFVARIWASPANLESFITVDVNNWPINLDDKLYTCKDGNIYPSQETIAQGLMVQALAVRILKRTLDVFSSTIADEVDNINDTSDENFLVASRTLDVCRALNVEGKIDNEAELVQIMSDPNYEPQEYSTKYDDVLDLVDLVRDKFLDKDQVSSLPKGLQIHRPDAGQATTAENDQSREEPSTGFVEAGTAEAALDPLDYKSIGVLAEKCRGIWVRAKCGFPFHSAQNLSCYVQTVDFRCGNNDGKEESYVCILTPTTVYKLLCVSEGTHDASLNGPVGIVICGRYPDTSMVQLRVRNPPLERDTRIRVSDMSLFGARMCEYGELLESNQARDKELVKWLTPELKTFQSIINVLEVQK